jgi:surface antigen
MSVPTSSAGSRALRTLQHGGVRDTVLGKRLSQTLKRKVVRKRAVRYSLLAANALLLVGVFGFIFSNSHKGISLTSASALSKLDATANPVDRITSYDIAANVAKAVNLPEENAVNNQAQTAKAALAVSSSSDSNVMAKPQIVATALKSRKDIKSYTVQAGEDLAAVALKFNVSSDSIRWSNNLSSNTVSAGTKLTVPPVNGLVYTVQNGDTVQTLATKFKANADQITASNDAELSGIYNGEQVLVPGGQIVAVAAARPNIGSAPANSSLGVSSLLTTIYGGNGYDFGYCTWYAYNERARLGSPVGSNWGNAVTWAVYAAAAGYRVDHTPTVGAVEQNGGGLGHVAVVESVTADGGWTVSEMNYRGWGVVSTRTLSASEAGNYNFIH